MAKEVIMPALGMAQETGTLLHWLKQEGETVTEGEPMMEVATDKVDVVIEAPASGTLAGISAAEGDEIPVGQTIAFILAAGETLAGASTADTHSSGAHPASATQPSRETIEGPPAASPVAMRMAAEHNVDLNRIIPAGSRIQKEDVLAYLEAQQVDPARRTSGGRVLASPKARRLAQEMAIDLSALTGSGPEGAVLAGDVLAAGAVPAAATPASSAPLADKEARSASQSPAVVEDVSRLWQVMATRLSESWTTVPHFYLTRDVAAAQLVAWRSQYQRQGKSGVTYTDLLVKLVAVALKRHPRLNSSWQQGRVAANASVNVGLAVAVEQGLLVPVLHNADQAGIVDLAACRADLVQRAVAGKLGPADLQGGTFTISNLGMYGVDAFNAIVNPPQAAILAVGRIADRVVPVDGQPAVRPMLTLTLSCDHRAVDGAGAAQFLATLADLIEEPLRALD